jgi:DMSO/TMAO reductase YedYZ molybdopterin-dependent catalytic subunit
MKRFLLLLLIAAGAIIVSGCLGGGGPKDLGTVEVRNYEGKDLSSINDFRENSIRGPQDVDIEGFRLQISGLVDNPRNLTYAEALGHQKYSKVVALHCVEGWSVTILWEGVLVSDLIDEAGAKAEANTVIFHAADGYTTTLPLDYIRGNDILLAYKMNNLTLTRERGFPFQVVAEDKWGYKWARWVTGIELSDDPEYRGYWESRGYSQEGGTSGPMLEGG